VADVCEELILGPIGRLGHLLRLSQLPFKPFTLGNVLDDADGICGLTGSIPLERDGDLAPKSGNAFPWTERAMQAAGSRVGRLMKKLGTSTRDAVRDVLVDLASEAVKTIIWLDK
jgi:hypothetical protein